MSQISQESRSSSENLEFKIKMGFQEGRAIKLKPKFYNYDIVPKYQQNLRKEVTYQEFKQMQEYKVDQKATT